MNVGICIYLYNIFLLYSIFLLLLVNFFIIWIKSCEIHSFNEKIARAQIRKIRPCLKHASFTRGGIASTLLASAGVYSQETCSYCVRREIVGIIVRYIVQSIE